VKWGGFASSSSREIAGSSTTPTLDSIVERGSRLIETEHPVTAVEDEKPPPPEEPYKPFNHEFDEPVRSTETQSSTFSQANRASIAQPQSLLTMQREGKRLSRKQKALLQAATISRTPLPKLGEGALAEAKETEEQGAEASSESRMETDEEKKRFQNRVWDLVRTKWF